VYCVKSTGGVVHTLCCLARLSALRIRRSSVGLAKVRVGGAGSTTPSISKAAISALGLVAAGVLVLTTAGKLLACTGWVVSLFNTDTTGALTDVVGALLAVSLPVNKATGSNLERNLASNSRTLASSWTLVLDGVPKTIL
jgi:hypothetical protein